MIDLGQLMNESQQRLAGQPRSSTPALDELVALVQAEGALYGAELIAAGFGSTCVALCRAGEVINAATSVLTRYNNSAQYQGRLLVPNVA